MIKIYAVENLFKSEMNVKSMGPFKIQGLRPLTSLELMHTQLLTFLHDLYQFLQYSLCDNMETMKNICESYPQPPTARIEVLTAGTRLIWLAEDTLYGLRRH